MKTWLIISLFLVLCFISSPVFAACTFCNGGTGGGMNQTPNMTPNMTATVDVNATFTGVPGSSAVVTNVGTIYAALFDFLIPTGAAGPMNQTPNMTQNMTMNQTQNMTASNLDTSWNISYLLTSGARNMMGILNMSGYNISNIRSVVASDDAANKSYVDTVNNTASANASAYSVAINASVNTNLTAYITAVNSTVGINNSYVTLSNGSYVQITNGSYVTIVNGSYVLITNTSYAKLVGGYVPTANLGSGVADATKYLRGDQSWQVPGGGSDPTASTTTLLYSDFYEAGLTTAIPGLTGLAISSGTAAVVATTANHPGVIYMRDSTTANGGYKYGCVGRQLIGGGETFEVVFQPVGIRAGQTAKIGWSDTAAARTLPVDGVFFNISGNGAAISLIGNVSSNSVRNGTNTAYAPTTATWYRGKIEINSAATKVTFTLYSEAGATLWTNTVESPIPTGAGRDTSPCIIVGEETTDAAADIVRLDYVKWGSTKTLVR